MTNEERKQLFIEKASAMSEHKDIDYSDVVYVDNRTPVKLYDRGLRPDGTEYGEFWQTPYNHLKGRCHPDKRKYNIAQTKSYTTEEIVARFKIVHKDENLDYSKVEYINMHTPVLIISHDTDNNGVKYGEFWQTPANHLKGCSHPRIATERNGLRQRLTNEEYVDRLKIIHSHRDYDYSLVDYQGEHSMIKLICNKIGRDGKPHGEFVMDATNLLAGKGCPKCGNHLSYAEEEIVEFVKSLKPDIDVKQHVRSIIPPMEIDIAFPEYKVGIEYNGLYWHGDNNIGNRDKNYHLNKTEKCFEHGWKLIHIFEDEYKLHKDIVLEKIARTLGIGNSKITKIHARKCIITHIDNSIAKPFLTENHIQGYKGATLHYGAYYNDELVGVMSFTKIGEEWELCRFTTKLWYSVRGLASKILKVFIDENQPKVIKSFADRRWTVDVNNNLYTKIGFKLDNILNPDYTYYNKKIDPIKRFHKFGFRKQILHKRYGLSMKMSEHEMTQELGYSRVWDCGLLKYVII